MNMLSSGYPFLTPFSFDIMKNKLDYYRGKDCMKNFSKDFPLLDTNIIN